MDQLSRLKSKNNTKNEQNDELVISLRAQLTLARELKGHSTKDGFDLHQLFENLKTNNLTLKTARDRLLHAQQALLSCNKDMCDQKTHLLLRLRELGHQSPVEWSRNHPTQPDHSNSDSTHIASLDNYQDEEQLVTFGNIRLLIKHDEDIRNALYYLESKYAELKTINSELQQQLNELPIVPPIESESLKLANEKIAENLKLKSAANATVKQNVDLIIKLAELEKRHAEYKLMMDAKLIKFENGNNESVAESVAKCACKGAAEFDSKYDNLYRELNVQFDKKVAENSILSTENKANKAKHKAQEIAIEEQINDNQTIKNQRDSLQNQLKQAHSRITILEKQATEQVEVAFFPVAAAQLHASEVKRLQIELN